METEQLKIPEIFEETDEWVEVEIPEGKSEEYDLEGYHKSGDGQDCKGNYFEYFTKYKNDLKKGVSVK